MHVLRISSSASPERGSYSELVREVRQQGLLRRRPRFYLLLGAVNLACLAAVVAGMVLLRDSWWIVLLAPAFAFVCTQIAFFSHDAAHHQIAQGGQVSALLALVHGNLLIGMSYGWWVAYTEANLSSRTPSACGTCVTSAPRCTTSALAEFGSSHAGDRRACQTASQVGGLSATHRSRAEFGTSARLSAGAGGLAVLTPASRARELSSG